MGQGDKRENVTSVAKDSIEIANQIEELRGKKLLNNIIEKELKKVDEKKKTAAHIEILKQIGIELPDLDGEQKAALEVSIKKLLTFNEKGGNVDFVAPDEDESEEEGGDLDAVNPALAQARAAIREYQQIREQIKLIEHKAG